MSARGFGSVIWAGAVAGAALGFYLVSLNVASERAELEDVETEIALAQRDIRLLQTEIGTRGRLAQLERWNVRFIRLSAPTADQFVDGGFQLATLVAPPRKPVIEAPVVLASAPVGQAMPQQHGMPDTADAVPRPVSEMVHVASYSVSAKPAPPKPIAVRPATPKAEIGASVTGKPQKRTAATKPVKSAMTDPLAPLPSARLKATGSAPASSGGTNPNRTLKDRVTD